jgi:hypothetical protein
MIDKTPNTWNPKDGTVGWYPPGAVLPFGIEPLVASASWLSEIPITRERRIRDLAEQLLVAHVGSGKSISPMDKTAMRISAVCALELAATIVDAAVPDAPEKSDDQIRYINLLKDAVANLGGLSALHEKNPRLWDELSYAVENGGKPRPKW